MKIYKKRYAIYGMIEQSSVFPMGNGHIRVDFKHGSLTTAGIVPATYTTSNPVVQQAIENSSKFKSGIIKLDEKVFIKDTGTSEDTSTSDVSKETSGGTEQTSAAANLGDPDPVADAGNKTDASENANTYPEVKNSQQAKDILMGEPFNVTLAELGNKAAIQAKAGELNVSFPNWK